ncbi:HAD-IB family phosphatase [Acidovorax sp. Root568]|uniref:HAD-IB family phosphatase n=1 Tax=Acidovorax sp. Root568 TaxID=1736565 RepID=UPI0009ECA748|nr:HAD-IB family phosphatase [Acidovorax sp. Root568]
MKFIFDLDGTLTLRETLPEIARAFHMEDKINALTAQAIRGEIPFMEGFIRRVNLLAHLSVADVAAVLERVEVNQPLVEFIAKNAADCVVATGNFEGWIEGLCKKIPCETVASKGEVDIRGCVRLTQILKKEDLVKAYQARGEKVVFIGDGNNDAEAMRLADVSIACGIVHKPAPSVMQVADYAVFDTAALLRLLEQIHQPCAGVSVVISAAGVGSRLGLGQTKSLIRLADKSLIEIQLKQFSAVPDVRIVVGFQAQDLIDVALQSRRDLVFVFNHDYFHTKTGASLYLGARHANEWVVAWDGDLLVHPDDIEQCLSGGANYVCVSQKASEDTVFVKVDAQQRVMAFADDDGDFEWSGPACFHRSQVHFTSGHVYALLEPLLPLPCKVIRARDIDTYEDYKKAVNFVSSWQHGNANIHKYYEQLAKKIHKPIETRNKSPDFSAFDIDFIRRFSGQSKHLLDLGAGTGLLINPLIKEFGRITAVEKYPQFSRFIAREPHVELIDADLNDFDTSERFDLITIFGVMNFFNRDEALKLYRKAIRWLQPGGVLILKHQMGIQEDVLVDGYSEELGEKYYSEYRWIQREIQLVAEAGFVVDEPVDIYPAAFNRWPNTHFYALVCHPNLQSALSS